MKISNFYDPFSSGADFGLSLVFPLFFCVSKSLEAPILRDFLREYANVDLLTDFRKKPVFAGFSGRFRWEKADSFPYFFPYGELFHEKREVPKTPWLRGIPGFLREKIFPWSALMTCSILAFGDKFLCKLTKSKKVQNTLLILQKYIILCRIECYKIGRNGAVLSKIYGKL